ncbi:unnamed protein product [Closterium sp. NIES-64]|nr:unnamed protein product [Closterium sp. NIES-65]CAI6000191.1 unnamed protein product [Closterium sp. NIES-64]CAI6006311.1 unnamed protein product [Closterium sp. NIES-65]
MALLARKPLFLASPSPSPTASNTRIPAPRPSLLRQHRLRLRICVAASSSSSPGDQKVAEQDESSLPPKESEVLSLKRESEQTPQPPPPRDTSASDSPRSRGRGGAGRRRERASVGEVVRGAVRAVEDAPVETVGAAAAASGLAVLGVVFATSLLGSLDSVPLAPEFMQTIGVVYCALVARQYFTKRKIAVAPTPLTAIQTLFPTTTTADADADADPEAAASRIPEGMGEGVQGRLRALEAERDVAVAAAGEMRRAGQEMARVVAEKEALEAVALQLADERDSAIAEVTALKTAVNAMTERMRAIEAMLASEVQRLQEQNLALETVALQLADERDSAIKQASELRSAFEAQREEDKRVLEMLAAQLIEERNAAVKEVQELKQVVAGLAEATGAGSGLTSEMEAFIRSRVRAVRAQFVDISKPYSQQEEAVNAFVAHLVDEFGAPREWTHRYIRQFLDAASDGHAIALNGPSPPSDRFN